MSKVTPLPRRRITEGEDEIELVDAPHCIPEGEYLVVYLYHETSYVFTTPKVYVHFMIRGGEYDGFRVYGAYRVEALKGKPRKGGGFKCRHSTKLFREMVRLNGLRERPERISLQPLKHALLRVRVGTVVRDHQQKPLPPALKYSIVREMLSLEAGSAW